ncbi:MAG: hypothetical protein A2Y33_13610 [Spirochaetes bacterium GWF1_51_8]|nr:MAG: hypothetical protein A2Y33_13610 [Spirochaetes bacterium GWF1_51_8]
MKNLLFVLPLIAVFYAAAVYSQEIGGGANMGEQFENSVDDMDGQDAELLGEILPKKVIVKLVSSSTLKPEGANNYSVKNVLDQKFSTCWAEGVKGQGIGEWIEISFSDGVYLEKIAIANGYLKTPDLTIKNSAVKDYKLVLYFDEQVWTVKGELGIWGTSHIELDTDQEVRDYTTVIDLAGGISIDGHELPDQPVIKLRIYIESVYPGTKYEDTCISDIFLYGFAEGYIN